MEHKKPVLISLAGVCLFGIGLWLMIGKCMMLSGILLMLAAEGIMFYAALFFSRIYNRLHFR